MKHIIQHGVIGTLALTLGACTTMGDAGDTAAKMVSLPMAPLGGVVCPPEEMVSKPEPVAQPVREMQCWDGSVVESANECPIRETVECSDGTLTYDMNECRGTRTDMALGDLCGREYRQENIYYAFNKGQSTETQDAINRILDIGEFCSVESISIMGHTDRSGSASYNLQLSERRAKETLEALVSQGVNRAITTSRGMGETQPFIPTDDGAKEPLNRRTEILIKLSKIGG